MTDERQVVQQAERWVREAMATNDPSHDFLHVDRVRSLALVIGRNMPVDLLVVELAGLLHDLDDAKYRKDRATSSVAAFLASTIGLDTSRADLVQRICENVSYSKERRRLDAGEETEWHRTCFELHCVQDADKLDAMGAIGTLRCAAYSAVIGRPLTLFDEDSVGGQMAIAHFHDKLLRLRGMMRTSEGQRLAESRHRFMLALLEQVALEHKNTLS